METCAADRRSPLLQASRGAGKVSGRGGPSVGLTGGGGETTIRPGGEKTPGGAFEPFGLPDPPGRHFLWLGSARERTGTGRRPGLRTPARSGSQGRPDSGPAGAIARREVLATRNPTLLLRFAGLFLLRYDDRAFLASLLNEPPRRTRLYGLRPTEGMFGEQPLPQSIGIGLAGVADPVHHPTTDVGPGRLPPGVPSLRRAGDGGSAYVVLGAPSREGNPSLIGRLRGLVQE